MDASDKFSRAVLRMAFNELKSSVAPNEASSLLAASVTPSVNKTRVSP